MTTCPACGADVPGGARFCPSCGTPVPAEPADEMLKLVTVLFADVVGSTARAEALHPEDVRALMTDFFAAMAAEIQAEGGTIEKYVGDAIMAVFGVPTAHEDDPVRAVRAGRRMLQRLTSWNEGRDPASRLELRIGVNSGEVIASGATGGELLATGDAVNVAARLQQVADPGTILISDRAARVARSHFELRPMDEPLLLKGKSAPVAAWLVEAERAAPEPRGMPGVEPPLVGRTHELASLRTTFARVCEGRRPELVTLVGDAGIGKSRLVREFLSSLDVEAKVLVGRCLPYGEGVTLWPLAEMLRAEAIVLDTDSADDVAVKIAQLVAASVDDDLIPEPSRTAAALASTLGLRLPDDPLASLDPRAVYRELIDAWRALLASSGRKGPIVAVVEDLHWADPTMLDVLDELAERLDGPMLFLCTARPELLRSRPDWGGGRRSFSALPLDPLSGKDSERLVAFLMDVDALSGEVRRQILERSEGNPFFLEEIVRRLIDDGLLVREGERWRAAAAIDHVEIPDNVNGVILARLDLLSSDEKRVAQRAAVVGRSFWDGALADLVDVDDLDGALRTLRRREFILERVSSSLSGQREFVFKHGLVRDVAYESLPRRERARAHAETAAWIERTSGDRAIERAELIAHHYDAAFSFRSDETTRTKARGYLLTAGAAAHRRFAIQQGERFARRAVELSEGAAERAEALEALGDLHYLAFLGDAAWSTYREALAELAEDDPAFPRLAGKAALFPARWVGTMHQLASTDEVHRLIEAGLRGAPEHGRERTLLLVNRAFLFVQRETRRDEEAYAAVSAAAAAAEELGDADLLSGALDLVEAWNVEAGRYGEMHRVALRRRGLVSQMSDVKEIGDSLAMAAMSAQHLGRYRDAAEHATECIERARGIDPGSYLHGLVWRVSARFSLGDWEGALADQEELESIAAEDPREFPAGFTLRAYAVAALCRELRGEGPQADRYVDLFLSYFAAKPDLLTRGARGRAPVAVLLARRGRFDEALKLMPLERNSASAGFTLEALCEITAMREAWDEAPTVVAATREEADIGEQLSLPLFADRLEGRAAAAAGHRSRATELLTRSADGFASLEARWEEAWSRLLFAEVVTGDDGSLAERELRRALEVFDVLHSVREAEQARALLAEHVV
jgi:class 3 adenylate cyclase